MVFGDGNGISWTIHKQSAPHFRQITTSTPRHSIFTGRMLFPTPNLQCQSTEVLHEKVRKKSACMHLLTVREKCVGKSVRAMRPIINGSL